MNRPTAASVNDERGIVSIVVTILIMIVLSLIIIGFAQLSRREQEQALDRQLNVQAFYAAESAVNDARQKFDAGQVDVTRDYTSDCDEFPLAMAPALDQEIGDNASYSCLLVDPSPTTLLFDPVDVNHSQVFPLQSKTTGQSISSVTFDWQPAEANGHNQAVCNPGVNISTWANAFPVSWSTDCKIGILRVEIVPYNGAQTRTNLSNATMVAFLYPNPANGSLSYAAAAGNNAGAIVPGGCSLDGKCSVTISNLNSAVSYVRIRSLYRSNAVTVSARNGSNAVELAGAQATVDATGKASDVIRRIQVRLDIDNLGESFAEFGLQSLDTICKRYAAAPPSTLNTPIGSDATECSVN